MIPVETANQIVDLWNGAATIGNGGSLPLGDDGCKLVISTKRWTLKCDTYDLCLSGYVNQSDNLALTFFDVNSARIFASAFERLNGGVRHV